MTMTDEQRKRLDQLKHALDTAAIDRDTYDAAAAALQAQLIGGGAIAQGQNALGVGVGAGGVGVGGDNYGDINLGVMIQRAAQPGASADTLRRAYLARALGQANQMPLFSGDSGNAQLRLSSVYTELLTQRGEGVGAGMGESMGDGKPSQRNASELDRQTQSALDGLNGERVQRNR